MSRRTEKRRYGKYNKFDVVYADFGKNPHGIQGGIRPGIIISCVRLFTRQKNCLNSSR